MAHEGAGFAYKGEGASLEFDPKAIPAKMKPAYEQLREHCTKCHTQERIVRCLQDCYVYGKDYEKTLREIIGRKLRLTGSDLSKAEGKSILELLLTMYRFEVTEHDKKK